MLKCMLDRVRELLSKVIDVPLHERSNLEALAGLVTLSLPVL